MVCKRVKLESHATDVYEVVCTRNSDGKVTMMCLTLREKAMNNID